MITKTRCNACGSTRKGDGFVDGTGYECPDCWSNVYTDGTTSALMVRGVRLDQFAPDAWGGTMSETITAQHVPHAMSREVETEVRARLDGVTDHEISDAAALAIASYWQSPAGHGATFAQLASTRKVDVTALLDAIASEYEEAKRQGALTAAELDMLATWALNHPSRVR